MQCKYRLNGATQFNKIKHKFRLDIRAVLVVRWIKMLAGHVRAIVLIAWKIN